MSIETGLIQDAATRLFSDHCERAVLQAAATGEWPAALWAAVEQSGLDRAIVSEAGGGAGAEPADAFSLVTIAAEHAAPVPLGETILATWLAERAGLNAPQGPLTLAATDIKAVRNGDGWHVSGRVARVPWGRDAAAVLLLLQPESESAPSLCFVPRTDLLIEPGDNVASEPRDTLVLETTIAASAFAPSPVSAHDLRALCAAVRTLQIAGAMRRIAEIAIDYAKQRVQFGKPIAKFQAIQQSLAVLATQVAMAEGAAQLAKKAITSGDLAGAGIAKACAGEAASLGVPIAHQVLGAIGFTLEHDLQFFSKRLLAWRDEFGAETEWNTRLGSRLLAAGADRLWPEITRI